MPGLFALSLCLVWPSSLARSRASRQPSTCSPSDLLPPGAGAIFPRESGRWFVSRHQQCTFWLFPLASLLTASFVSPPNWPRASRGPPAFQARSRSRSSQANRHRRTDARSRDFLDLFLPHGPLLLLALDLARSAQTHPRCASSSFTSRFRLEQPLFLSVLNSANMLLTTRSHTNVNTVHQTRDAYGSHPGVIFHVKDTRVVREYRREARGVSK